MPITRSAKARPAPPPADRAVPLPDPILSRNALAEALANPPEVRRRNLGSLLTGAGLVEPQGLAEAMAEQALAPERRLGDLLVAGGRLSENDLYRALAEQLGMPYVRLGDFEPDRDATAIIPQELVRQHRVLPLMLHNGHLVLATADPTDGDALSALRFRAQRPLELVLVSPADLDLAIAAHFPPFDDDALLAEAEQLRRRNLRAAEPEAPENLAQEQPIVRLVSNLLNNAVQRRASDIHLRPREHRAEACYRIDGALMKIGEFHSALVPAIVARIKVLAGMNVAEHRLPQDGAIHMETVHGAVDMRVSIMPAMYGENVVIRILDRSVALRRLSDVGFDAAGEKRLRGLLDRNQGLLLVTGPTGSGKTTTLYAALQELNTGEYHIITVEDPVEYRLDGLVQIQAQAGIGYGFPQALRHILRHDPDIVLIGEIRDAETARIAVESALTGHLVLSTLHTNSAVQTVTRLMEIGIPPYLVNATLAGVLAQRLARRNCPHCRQPEEVAADVREWLGVDPGEVFWKSTGCDRCLGTGCQGRVATYELLQITPALRQLVSHGATPDDLEQQAVRDGMVPLGRQALGLARQGIISLAEAYRVRLD